MTSPRKKQISAITLLGTALIVRLPIPLIIPVGIGIVSTLLMARLTLPWHTLRIVIPPVLVIVLALSFPLPAPFQWPQLLRLGFIMGFWIIVLSTLLALALKLTIAKTERNTVR